MFEITLPLPPSVNESYAVVRGRKILTKKARDWVRVAQITIETGLQDSYFSERYYFHINKQLRVKVNVNFVFPDNRRRDQSNYLKQLYDGITKCRILYDDSQIIEEHIYSRVEKGKREVRIKIEEIT
jgi:Holliday junction resolvase RusA-like endonuclease